MNSRERFLAVLAGETPDMVPVVPVLDGYFAPKLIGRRNDDCWADGNCLAEALAAAQRQFDHDGVVAEMGLGPDPDVLGCRVEIEGNQVPLVVETLVEDAGDLAKIPIPDPWRDGKMEPVRRLAEQVGREAAILGSVRSPFEYAATVRGLAGFFADFYRDPEFAHQLIAACLPATLAVGKALVRAGADAIVIKDSFASTSMISPAHYREFAYPAEAEAIAALKETAPVILHICRNSLPILPEMARTGAAALEIDSPVDLEQARQAVDGKVVLKGNIDAVAVMEKGSPADVERAVKVAMAAAKAGGRFILSTGDSIPAGAPLENVAALVEFGRAYGKY